METNTEVNNVFYIMLCYLIALVADIFLAYGLHKVGICIKGSNFIGRRTEKNKEASVCSVLPACFQLITLAMPLSFDSKLPHLIKKWSPCNNVCSFLNCTRGLCLLPQWPQSWHDEIDCLMTVAWRNTLLPSINSRKMKGRNTHTHTHMTYTDFEIMPTGKLHYSGVIRN